VRKPPGLLYALPVLLAEAADEQPLCALCVSAFSASQKAKINKKETRKKRDERGV
jgi:hypothetical protein